MMFRNEWVRKVFHNMKEVHAHKHKNKNEIN